MNIPSQEPTPPKNFPSPTAFSSPPDPHPRAAPPAQLPSPSRNHHAPPRSLPRAHRNVSKTFSALRAAGYSETIPAAPSRPPPGSRSSLGASPPTSTSRPDRLAERDFHSEDLSNAPALHSHDCFSPPRPTHFHTCVPAPPPAAPTQTEESAHATPHTGAPCSARSPAHKHSPLLIRHPPCPLQ